MSANRELLERWMDAINRRDLSDIDDMIGADIVDHHLPHGLPPGRAGVRYWLTLLDEALQMQISIDDMVEQNDRIAVRATISGCHVADFMGLAATNRTFVAQVMTIERFADGRIVERWEYVDTTSIVQQLTNPD